VILQLAENPTWVAAGSSKPLPTRHGRARSSPTTTGAQPVSSSLQRRARHRRPRREGRTPALRCAGHSGYATVYAPGRTPEAVITRPGRVATLQVITSAVHRRTHVHRRDHGRPVRRAAAGGNQWGHASNDGAASARNAHPGGTRTVPRTCASSVTTATSGRRVLVPDSRPSPSWIPGSTNCSAARPCRIPYSRTTNRLPNCSSRIRRSTSLYRRLGQLPAGSGLRGVGRPRREPLLCRRPQPRERLTLDGWK
jgi:hypothetical protein